MTTSKWTVDTTHSEVQFKVKHLMITTVTGYFTRFNLEVETEGEDLPDPPESCLRPILIPSTPTTRNGIPT
jgi:hypothetical protein